MEVFDALMTRRSVREYSGKEVKEKDIEALLRAAMQAPSAGHSCPWHFVVVKDKGKLRELSLCSPHAAMIANASACIVVCADLSNERYKGYWMLDCSNATFSILLAAHALGLGAVWIALYHNEDRMENARSALGIPKSMMPLAAVPIGYPAEKIEPEDRFDKTRVHEGKW